ncbi:carboxymuconolactone decarboxylase family protein [Salinicola halophilus]|uniref:carboxymuconolactone decarboxylase family protein n=1 Tax=Salinicola halophilus TaxID=184065 RepID=UPI000DA1A5DF|nr:carboxymuconolactone decarboxylase family protein [Salinicola halophilus]
MSDTETSRRRQALALLARLEATAPEKVAANLDDFDAEALEILLGFGFTDVVSRQGLALPTRELLTVAMLAAMGTASGQLEFHVRGALNVGVSREEIVETLLQVAVYAGVPAAINAIAAAKRAFAAHAT